MSLLRLAGAVMCESSPSANIHQPVNPRAFELVVRFPSQEAFISVKLPHSQLLP